MGKLFVKVKNAFSRSKDLEQCPTNTSESTCSISPQSSENTAPSYHHAAASQPPAYQPLPTQPQPPVNANPTAPRSTFQEQAREIAKIQVGGLRRTDGAGGASSYFTSYAPVQPTGPPPSACMHKPSQSTDSAYSHSSDEKKDGAASGTRQETPGGKTWDHRQKLSEEDEDLWSRMAM